MFELLTKMGILPKGDIRTLLGRWCILNKQLNNRKIDLANIDHCGSCSYTEIKDVQPTLAHKHISPNSIKCPSTSTITNKMS